MRRTGLLLSFAAVLFLLAGCAGPFYAFRTVDDFANRMYVDAPWMTQAFYYIPAIPLCMFVGWVIDWVGLNPWYFWTKDAWRNRGTAFNHKMAQGPARPEGDRVAKGEPAPAAAAAGAP